MVEWRVNRGLNQPSDIFPLSRFADEMRRPDIVGRVLETLDETQAIELADAAAGLSNVRQAQKLGQQSNFGGLSSQSCKASAPKKRGDKSACSAVASYSNANGPITPRIIATLLPPVIDKVDIPATFSSDHVTVKFRVREADNSPWKGEPRVKVNGEWQPRSRAVSQVAPDVRTLTIGGLLPKDSVIEIYADNANSTSTPLVIPLTWDKNASVATRATPAPPLSRKPRLFILAIGVSQYQRPDLRLTFADHDAEQLVAAMAAQQGREYTSVTTKLLVNGQATRAAVMEGLNWLQSQVAADDVGLLFLAGHGLEASDSHYFFAPTDFDPNHPRDSGVEYIAIRDALVRFEGKGNRTIFLIDTCHSGGVLGANTVSSSGEAFGRSLGANQYAMAGLTSSTGGQVSLEKVDWGDGAFTKALLEGIVQAKADSADSHEITMLGLGYYVSQRVKVLTQQAQTPMFISPESGLKDFVIAIH